MHCLDEGVGKLLITLVKEHCKECKTLSFLGQRLVEDAGTFPGMKRLDANVTVRTASEARLLTILLPFLLEGIELEDDNLAVRVTAEYLHVSHHAKLM